jgi:hypothetical protein
MELNGIKVLEGKMPKMNLENFLKPEFVELLKNEMEDVKVIHIGLATGSKDEQHISSLAHVSSEDFKNNMLSIKVKEENELDQILDVIKSFNKANKEE